MGSSRSSETEPPVARRPGGRTRDTSERIFATAIDILTEDGYRFLNFQDVAERAGVSRTTLYRRWPTKAELVLDVLSYALAERVRPADTGSFIGDITASLRQIGVVLQSPFGRAAIAASIEMERAAEGAEWRQELWIRRFTDFQPLFARAKARGDLPKGCDDEAALAAIAGAMYYRVLMMARPIDDKWIGRVLAVVAPAQSAKPRRRPGKTEK